MAFESISSRDSLASKGNLFQTARAKSPKDLLPNSVINQIQIQTVHRLHLSDQQQDYHYVVNAR